MAEVLCAENRSRMSCFGSFEPRVLRPFDRREGCQIEEAANIAGRAVRTMRLWAEQHHIARRVGGGPWVFSRVALHMFLDGDERALAAYLAGDRSNSSVVAYYERNGLADLIRQWRNNGAATAAIST